jgi:cytochrome bd-type quinol oxidase subunit 2
MLYLPMGSVTGHEEIHYYLNGFSIAEEQEMFYSNYYLSALLVVIMILQALSIFDFKNRKRQVVLVQISLILLVALAVGILMYPDMAGIPVQMSSGESHIDFSWAILFMVVPWILTYLAIRAIKKDESLVRSADRMR